jgi:hypothetical protein
MKTSAQKLYYRRKIAVNLSLALRRVNDASRPVGKISNLPSITLQLQNMRAGVQPVSNLNIAAIIDLDVVSRDRHLATRATSGTGPAFVGFIGDCWHVAANLQFPHSHLFSRTTQ